MVYDVCYAVFSVKRTKLIRSGISVCNIYPKRKRFYSVIEQGNKKDPFPFQVIGIIYFDVNLRLLILFQVEWRGGFRDPDSSCAVLCTVIALT